jgi:hypothetical protein
MNKEYSFDEQTYWEAYASGQLATESWRNHPQSNPHPFMSIAWQGWRDGFTYGKLQQTKDQLDYHDHEPDYT